MKLITQREELSSKLSTVSRAVSTRAATQALSGILLATSETAVELSATDGEIGLRTDLEATVEGSGTVLLPGRLLADLVRSLADEKVEIELREAERDVEIRCGG
ncbi:MAG TPA: DNA polymerase III subunit beta, partial [Solirubrobacterales bacterium]